MSERSDEAVLAITGATGGLGGRVATRLAARSVPQRLVVRDPARAPDLPLAGVRGAAFGDAAAMRSALAGVQTLLLIPAHEERDRVATHTTAIRAALDAGVERIVYVSVIAAAPDATFTFARDHWATEEAIKAAGVRHVFPRMSLYLDFVAQMAGPDGVIRGPAGNGRLAWIARDDLADVIVEVLTGSGFDGASLDVTGPESVSMRETAETISRVTGRLISYQSETLEQARRSRAGYGVEDWRLEGWVSSYAAIASGELDVVSDTVERLTGHPPQSVEDFIRANPASWPAAGG